MGVYVGVVLLAVANCVVLYFMSVLAVGGDGSSGGITSIRWMGFTWIAATTVAALVFCARRRTTAAILTAATALATGHVALIAGLAAAGLYGWVKPSSAEFEAACRSAGPHVLAAPRAPVRSIACDWEDKYPPRYTYFKIGFNDYAGTLREWGLFRAPPAVIEFTEARCCEYDERPANRIGP